MPEKRDSYAPSDPVEPPTGVQVLATQQSVDLLTSLLQEFERRSQYYPVPATTPPSGVRPEVERDIAFVNAGFDSITSALTLRDSPLTVASVNPYRGPTTGGTKVTITGSHLLPGAQVRFGVNSATAVTVISLTEIEAITPPGVPGTVDVVVATLAGAVTAKAAFTYQTL
jgi:hypothetical protein